MNEPHDADDALLIGWLEDHDERCPVCQYALAGLTVTTCPECGSALRLGVTSPGVRYGPWVVAMLSYALALGFDAVVSILMSWFLITQSPIGAWQPWVMTGMFLLVAIRCGVLLMVTVRRRKWWLSGDAGHRWARAGIVFVAVGGGHLGFAVLLRVLGAW